MSNKIALIYENNKYLVYLNDKVVNNSDSFEEAVTEFEKVVKNNKNSSTTSWEYIKEKISEVSNGDVIVDEEYKTISYSSMKYFHNSNKVFYITSGSMIPVVGGFTLFNFILLLIHLGYIKDCDEILNLCSKVTENKSNYRTTDLSLIITSAAFNYGSVEYNFRTGKINKGVIIEDSSYEEFEKYVLSIIE